MRFFSLVVNDFWHIKKSGIDISFRAISTIYNTTKPSRDLLTLFQKLQTDAPCLPTVMAA